MKLVCVVLYTSVCGPLLLGVNVLLSCYVMAFNPWGTSNMRSAWLPACEGVPVWWCRGIVDTSDEMWILLRLNVDQMLACLSCNKEVGGEIYVNAVGTTIFCL